MSNVEFERIEEDQALVLVKKRTFDKPYQEKHYDRYIPTTSNDTLGVVHLHQEDPVV